MGDAATLHDPASYVRAMSRTKASTSYSIPVDRLDDRNLLILILERVEGLTSQMTELNQAVADLGAAVSGVTTRLADLLTKAQAEVATAQERVAALQADDDTDKQAIADGLQRVADLNTEAQAASGQIEASVASLNEIAADKPVDPSA